MKYILAFMLFNMVFAVSIYNDNKQYHIPKDSNIIIETPISSQKSIDEDYIYDIVLPSDIPFITPSFPPPPPPDPIYDIYAINPPPVPPPPPGPLDEVFTNITTM